MSQPNLLELEAPIKICGELLHTPRVKPACGHDCFTGPSCW